MHRSSSWARSITLAAAVLAVAPAASHAAPLLEAYALSAAGTSLLGAVGGGFSCATFGPDPRTVWFNGVFQVGLPSDGAGCGVAGDSRMASTTSGGVSVASTLAVGWGRSPDLRSFTGGSGAHAGFGRIGARADASYAGSSDAFTVTGAQAFGRSTDTLTFAGSGSGWFRPTFTIDGSLFNVGRTDSQIALFYGFDGGPSYLAFRINNNRADLNYYGPGGYTGVPAGMAVSGDLATGLTVSGSTRVTLNIPVTFGMPTDITFALWAGTLPGSNTGLLTTSAGNVAFDSTATLSAIEVVDASGHSVAPDITAASGWLYRADGVSPPVPEPGSGWTVALGLLALWTVRHRRRA